MKPIDYSQTIMYKLVPKDLNSDLIYVGHTTNFTKRKNYHKTYCSNINGKQYNYTVYKMIRENGGWNEWQMIQIEVYSCQNKREAEKRERELMEEFNANLNMVKSFTTQEEKKNNDIIWREVNRDKISKNKKQFRQENIELVRLQEAKSREKNRDAINARQNKRYQQKKLEKEQKKLSLDML